MDKRIVYVGTPKCASASIKSVLNSKYKVVVLDPMLKDTNAQHISRPPLDASELGGQFPWKLDGPLRSEEQLGDAECLILDFYRPPIWAEDFDGSKTPVSDFIFSENFYKWTVVRNPWHRIASTFEWLNLKRKGCHGTEICRDFKSFVTAATSPTLPHICSHSEPERYINKLYDGDALARLVSAVSYASPQTHFRTVEGYLAGLREYGFYNVMRSCNKETAVHTQRWEDSNLFNSSTFVHTFSKDELAHVIIKQFEHSLKNDPHVVEQGLSVYTGNVTWALFNHPDVGPQNWGGISLSEEKIPHQLDRVIKFESLLDGIEEVCNDLGVPTWDLPRKNMQEIANKLRHYEELYKGNDNLIQLVRDSHVYEIEQFGYEFGTHL